MAFRTAQAMSGQALLVPELIQPDIQLEEAAIVDGVEALGPGRLGGDKAGIEQHLEMLRHRRSRHRQAGREFIDGFGPVPQFLEELPTVWVGYGGKGVDRTHALIL